MYQLLLCHIHHDWGRVFDCADSNAVFDVLIRIHEVHLRFPISQSRSARLIDGHTLKCIINSGRVFFISIQAM